MAASASELSLLHPSGYLHLPGSQPFGKDVANLGLFRALARFGGHQRINVLHQSSATASELAPQYLSSDPAGRSLATASLWNTDLPQRSGQLLRGSVAIADLAWLRRSARADDRYSLIGVVHTTAPPFIRSQIAATALAPIHPWDAVVCTSPSVQQGLEAMFENQERWLVERLGAQKRPRPALPLIPLGVEASEMEGYRHDAAARAGLRQRLALGDDDLLVLWVGRLSYFEKAFPQAMLQAVQQAQAQTSRRLVLALAGWFPNGEADQRLYEQAVRQLAPRVQVSLLNGGNPALLAQAWAAADAFISLVDNIQETFGLAPVEAMAAGLPVVVSDWDGYRYTVRDGIDGFRIPTLASPGGSPGERLALLHTLELETYQAYVGAVAQHTAVHVGRAAEALVALANSPELRRRQGAAGKQRARQLFDWPVVVGQYNELFAELADRRAQGLRDGCSTLGSHMQPSRGDPFADFRGFATAVLEPATVVRLSVGVAVVDLQARLEVELNRLYSGQRGTPAEARALLQRLDTAGAGGLSVAGLLADAAPERRPYLETTLVWLAKMALIDWLPPSDRVATSSDSL